jgi:hypothetical protein
MSEIMSALEGIKLYDKNDDGVTEWEEFLDLFGFSGDLVHN